MGSQLGKQQKEEIKNLVTKLSLSNEDRDYTVETFRKFCRFNRKTMNREDFKDFLTMMNMTSYNELLISTVFQVLDTNADGELSAGEFIRYFILLIRFPVATKVQIVFDIIDRDASGSIELAEIRRYYHDLVNSRSYLVGGRDGQQLTGRDIDKLFDQMDSDSNKKVDAKEFEQHAKANGPQLLQLLDAYIDE